MLEESLSFLKKDIIWLYNISKSCIGWKNERPIRHFELLKHIKEERYDIAINIVNKIKERINEENICKVLANYEESIISTNMKKLILKYIIARRDIIVSEFEGGE